MKTRTQGESPPGLSGGGGGLTTLTGLQLDAVDHIANATLSTSGAWVVRDNLGASGTVILTLPLIDLSGYVFIFYQASALNALRLKARVSDFIRTPAGQSATNGFIQSVVAGSTAILVSNSGEFWQAFLTGTWTIDS